MLAEILQNAGFQTAAILGAMPLGPHANFVQGFDFVDADFRRPRETRVYEQAERPGDLVTDAALKWVNGIEGDRLFLFVHYFDAHQPYESTSDKVTGSMRAVYRLRRQVRDSGSTSARAISEDLKPLYWAEIGFVDTQIGRLLDGLSVAGVLQDAMVVLTADHGESYLEHGEVWDHGMHVYDQTVHTPLIVRFPGLASDRLEAVVSSVDVMPTILDILALSTPEVDGRSLQPLLSGERWSARPVFSEATKPWEPGVEWHNSSRRKAVRIGDYKLIWNPKTGIEEIYDVVNDPHETDELDPISARAPLMEAMTKWISEADPLPSEKVTAPDITEHLKALGYVE